MQYILDIKLILVNCQLNKTDMAKSLERKNTKKIITQQDLDRNTVTQCNTYIYNDSTSEYSDLPSVSSKMILRRCNF